MLRLGLVCLSHVIQGRNLCAGQKEERERDQKNGGKESGRRQRLCLGCAPDLEYLPLSIVSSILLNSRKDQCLCIICGTWSEGWALYLLWLRAAQSSKWRKRSEPERNHAEVLWCHRAWNLASGQGYTDFPGMGSPSWYPGCTTPFIFTSTSPDLGSGVAIRHWHREQRRTTGCVRPQQNMTISLWLWESLRRLWLSTSVLCSGLPFPSSLSNASILYSHPQILSPRIPDTSSLLLPSHPYFERFYWPKCICSHFTHFPIFWQSNAV